MNEQQFIAAIDKPIAVYTEFEAQLIKLEKENETAVFDYANHLGEKAARSHIHKLRLTKGVIDRARKSEKENALTYGRRVDGEAKTLIGRIEAMIDVHQKPLDEIKEKEVERKEGIKTQLRIIEGYGQDLPAFISDLEQRLSDLQAIEVGASFDEYMSIATTAKDVATKALDEALVAAIKAKKDADELEVLRSQKAAQERQEREDRLKKEAAEEAERKANEVAAEHAERIQAEHKAELEAKDAAAKAEREAAERAEREAKEAAERVEAEHLDKIEQAEAEVRAGRERAERAERESVTAKAEAEQDQRDKDEVKRLSDEARAADEKHRTSIHTAIMAAFEALSYSPDSAHEIVDAICDGRIPHVSINY